VLRIFFSRTFSVLIFVSLLGGTALGQGGSSLASSEASVIATVLLEDVPPDVTVTAQQLPGRRDLIFVRGDSSAAGVIQGDTFQPPFGLVGGDSTRVRSMSTSEVSNFSLGNASSGAATSRLFFGVVNNGNGRRDFSFDVSYGLRGFSSGISSQFETLGDARLTVFQEGVEVFTDNNLSMDGQGEMFRTAATSISGTLEQGLETFFIFEADSFSTTGVRSVPEPSSAVLFLLLTSLGLVQRRR